MEENIEAKKNKKINEFKRKNNNSGYSTHIYALGGLDEVGKNMYCFESPKELIVFDAGQKFTQKSNLAADAMIPNINFLKKNESKLSGLFITHGHEDHIGAIPYLLKHVNIPRIYTTPIAESLIKNKLRMAKIDYNPKIFNIVNINRKIKLRDFEVTPFSVNHSIPQALGYKISDKNGTSILTGDFKFDLTAPGRKASYDLISKWGKDGVDLLMADSTNSKIKGFSKSELEIGNEIRKIIKHTDNRIIISTFASNMHRVKQIVRGAKEANKKICIIGRSMVNAIDILIEQKLIENGPWLINDRAIKNFNPKEIVILCTGSQGETLAALNRIADKRHNTVRIEKNDHVIFSSSPIPGNTYFVNELSNSIVKQGGYVIENSFVESIHASGHGYELEQKLMLNLVNPKYFFPVHGNMSMLAKHKETATQCQIDERNIFVLSNGQVLQMKNNKVTRNHKRLIPSDFIFVQNQNSTLLENNSEMESITMSSEGIVTIQVIVNKKPEIIKNGLEVNFRGCINIRGFRTTNKIRNIVKESINDFQVDGNYISNLREELKIKTSEALFNELKIKPIVLVSVSTL